MTTVYIASPYTKGDQALNVRKSLEAAEQLREAGFLPFTPLLSHFWHCIFPHEYEYWMKMDLEWLAHCDALLRLPGESSGADEEVKFALGVGMPVFYSIQDIVEWYAPKQWQYSEGECICELCESAQIHQWYNKTGFSEKEIDNS